MKEENKEYICKVKILDGFGSTKPICELIRCKDCIWRYQSQINDLHYCFETNIEVSDDDFCSRAKRRIE